ncbi:hypothetical protein JHK87_052491 [Glycine soja]|nr:hypothetical protein JHK87_052491 [Glycine soja]
MARRVMGHGDAVCWFCCRDETNGMRPDAEDLDDDGDGDESDDIHGDDPIRGLDMIL